MQGKYQHSGGGEIEVAVDATGRPCTCYCYSTTNPPIAPSTCDLTIWRNQQRPTKRDQPGQIRSLCVCMLHCFRGGMRKAHVLVKLEEITDVRNNTPKKKTERCVQPPKNAKRGGQGEQILTRRNPPPPPERSLTLSPEYVVHPTSPGHLLLISVGALTGNPAGNSFLRCTMHSSAPLCVRRCPSTVSCAVPSGESPNFRWIPT